MRNKAVNVRLSLRQAEALLQLAEEADFDTFDCHDGQAYRWRRSAGIALDKLTTAIVDRRVRSAMPRPGALSSDRSRPPEADAGSDGGPCRSRSMRRVRRP